MKPSERIRQITNELIGYQKVSDPEWHKAQHEALLMYFDEQASHTKEQCSWVDGCKECNKIDN